MDAAGRVYFFERIHGLASALSGMGAANRYPSHGA